MKHSNRTFSSITSMKIAKSYAVRLVSQFLVHVNGLTTPNLWIVVIDHRLYRLPR